MATGPPIPEVARLRARMRQELVRRFFVRWHMSLILAGVVLAGVATSKLLLLLGVGWIGIRWVLAVVASYLVFFALVRLWVAYAAPGAKKRRADLGVDLPDLPGSLGGEPSLPPLRAGGGRFGGGGASGSFEGNVGAHSGGGSGGGIVDSLGLDSEEGVVILVVLGLLLLALFGAGAYLVYEAPAILGEAWLEVVLASSLVRASRRLEARHWAGGVFRATIVPFGLVLLLTGVFGWVAHAYCPHAPRLADIMRRCVLR
jgi:hypothetical protein